MTNLEKTFELSKKMASLANQKRLIFEQYDLDLFFFENNAVFKCTKELISYIKTVKDLSNDTSIVILDESYTPVKIDDIELFLRSIVNIHIQANNKLFFEYEKIKKEIVIESILK